MANLEKNVKQGDVNKSFDEGVAKEKPNIEQLVENPELIFKNATYIKELPERTRVYLALRATRLLRESISDRLNEFFEIFNLPDDGVFKILETILDFDPDLAVEYARELQAPALQRKLIKEYAHKVASEPEKIFEAILALGLSPEDYLSVLIEVAKFDRECLFFREYLNQFSPLVYEEVVEAYLEADISKVIEYIPSIMDNFTFPRSILKRILSLGVYRKHWDTTQEIIKKFSKRDLNEILSVLCMSSNKSKIAEFAELLDFSKEDIVEFIALNPHPELVYALLKKYKNLFDKEERLRIALQIAKENPNYFVERISEVTSDRMLVFDLDGNGYTELALLLLDSIDFKDVMFSTSSIQRFVARAKALLGNDNVMKIARKLAEVDTVDFISHFGLSYRQKLEILQIEIDIGNRTFYHLPNYGLKEEDVVYFVKQIAKHGRNISDYLEDIPLSNEHLKEILAEYIRASALRFALYPGVFKNLSLDDINEALNTALNDEVELAKYTRRKSLLIRLIPFFTEKAKDSHGAIEEMIGLENNTLPKSQIDGWGEFYEVLMELAHALFEGDIYKNFDKTSDFKYRPPFKISFDFADQKEDGISNKKLKKYVSRLTELFSLLANTLRITESESFVERNKALERICSVLNKLNSPEYTSEFSVMPSFDSHDENKTFLIITPQNVNEIIAVLNNTFMGWFLKMAQLGETDQDNIKALRLLEEKWGDLDVFITLFARFSGKDESVFADESEIEIMRDILRHELEGRFYTYKYDTPEAKEQLSFFTQEQKNVWRENPSTLTVALVENTSAQDTLKEQTADILRALQQTAGNISHLLERDGGKYSWVKERFDDISDKEIDKINIEQIQKLIDSLAKPASRDSKNRGALEQVRSDLENLKRKLKNLRNFSKREAKSAEQKAEKAIIFTTVVDDAKTMLEIGSIVDTSSCQNYKTGEYVETLPGYVIDAQIKAILSFVLTSRDFASVEDFQKVANATEDNKINYEFNPYKKSLTLQVGKDSFQINLDRRAYRRHIIKAGKVVSENSDMQAGIFLERAYTQNPPNCTQSTLAKEVEKLISQWSRRGRWTHKGVDLKIAGSRNPSGHYSDAKGGPMQESYVINSKDL